MPRLTETQHYALSKLARGAQIEIDGGEYFLNGRLIGRDLLITLVTHGLVTLPQPEMPLFSVPAQPGLITEAGRAVLEASL